MIDCQVTISTESEFTSGHDKFMTKKAEASTKHRDFVVQALKLVVEPAIGEHFDGTPLDIPKRTKNPHAIALARLGAKKGGHARAARLSAKRRSEIAKKAAAARWNKQ
jgi:hypothetical protein